MYLWNEIYMFTADLQDRKSERPAGDPNDVIVDSCDNELERLSVVGTRTDGASSVSSDHSLGGCGRSDADVCEFAVVGRAHGVDLEE